MQNGNFRPRSQTIDKVVSGFKNFVEQQDSNGTSVLVECANPYEGLDSSSFDLKAQLEAGVPMVHVSGYSAASLHAVDSNNIAADKFIDKINNEKKVS